MGDEPLKSRIEARQPNRLVTRDWEGRLSPGQAAFSQPTEPRTTGHLHVTLGGMSHSCWKGGVCQAKGCVGAERQTMFCGIWKERKIGNEPMTEVLCSRLKEKQRGLHSRVLVGFV